jgi:hypothetical protein
LLFGHGLRQTGVFVLFPARSLIYQL